jgi:UDP-N-acetylmuramoylalanine--D-glutamate ligase
MRRVRALGYSCAMEYRDIFAGKRITLMGLGLLGRGVGDAEFLARSGAQVLVTDKKSEAELAPSVEALKKYSNITFKLGGHDMKDFTTCDMVVKAAGVRLDSPEIAAACAAGVPVMMSTALFAKYARDAGATIVGVTGTRGKSSVTHMIFHTLKTAGRPTILGGNVRNISTLAMLPDVHEGDIAVLELDSWQLQGFGELQLSPQIALFTNLMSDHQDYYKNVDEYFADKANIFNYQREGDSLFVGEGVLRRVKAMKPAATLHVPSPIPNEWSLQVVGEHNRENAAFAAAALSVLGLSQEEIKTGLASFVPVEGRLQFVREVNGMKIYNDNNATTPEATVAALKALGKNITLIAGGSEKGLPLDELVAEIKKDVSQVILLTHEKYKGSERLAEIFKREEVAFLGADSIENALRAALSLAHGGTILFSPAFASFGMFKNEYERNDEFLRLVRTADAS